MAYKSRLAGEEADLLCDAVLALQTREECYRFFDDLLTMNEFVSMAQRVAVARMLYNGRTYPYMHFARAGATQHLYYLAHSRPSDYRVVDYDNSLTADISA